MHGPPQSTLVGVGVDVGAPGVVGVGTLVAVGVGTPGGVVGTDVAVGGTTGGTVVAVGVGALVGVGVFSMQQTVPGEQTRPPLYELHPETHDEPL